MVLPFGPRSTGPLRVEGGWRNACRPGSVFGYYQTPNGTVFGMRTRTSAADLEASGFDALSAALSVVDVRIADRSGTPPDGWDGVLPVTIDTAVLTLVVEVKASCNAAVAHELVRRPIPADAMPVLVADRITSDAREVLSASGWSWLDRRGRLHLRGPAVRIDVDVPGGEAQSSGGRNDPLGTGAGLGVGYWLSSHPGSALSPSRHAELLGMAPSTISVTVRGLREAGLVDDDGVGLFPELFWELARQWSGSATALASSPSPTNAWRRGGTAASVAHGAPVVASEGQPVELYVASQLEVTMAARRFGTTAGPGAPALLRIAPTPLLFSSEAGPRVGRWLSVPLLTAALDLAQDRARGREILEEWAVNDAVWR